MRNEGRGRGIEKGEVEKEREREREKLSIYDKPVISIFLITNYENVIY